MSLLTSTTILRSLSQPLNSYRKWSLLEIFLSTDQESRLGAGLVPVCIIRSRKGRSKVSVFERIDRILIEAMDDPEKTRRTRRLWSHRPRSPTEIRRRALALDLDETFIEGTNNEEPIHGTLVRTDEEFLYSEKLSEKDEHTEEDERPYSPTDHIRAARSHAPTFGSITDSGCSPGPKRSLSNTAMADFDLQCKKPKASKSKKTQKV
ncbi:hypothetical protein DFH11DRAFT_1543456 [Phellopilus nigrolimitatus]|nr:hypothetical protein DFH11DRAFT_1543456 [Phellopilus nigrolimitatus]